MSKKIAKKDLNESLVEEGFKPTPFMIVWVDAAVRMLGEPNIRIAEETGIDESTYYKWKKDPKFIDWYTEAYAKRRRRLIPQLDEIAMKFAKRGSYSHLDLLNKKAGEDYDKGSGTVVNVQTNVVNVDENEMQEFIKWRDSQRRKVIEE